MIDQIDWDGALTHRIGKIHQVGMFNLSRQRTARFGGSATPLIRQFKEAMAAGRRAGRQA